MAKSRKNGLSIIFHSLITVEPFNLNDIVANGKTFTVTYDMMALTSVQGRRVTLKMWENGLSPISQTLIRVKFRNLYHVVAKGKAFSCSHDMMTLTLIQGRWVTLEVQENGVLMISQTLIRIGSLKH